jgi:hypothetical protein
MKTSRPEKKPSCAHADSNSTLYAHWGGEGKTATKFIMAKNDNEFLTGALQNSIMRKKRFRSPAPPRGVEVSSKSAPAGVTPVALRAPYVTPAELNNVILDKDT